MTLPHTELMQSKSMWLHCINNGKVQTLVKLKTAWDRMELFIRPHEIYRTEGYHTEPFIISHETARNRLYETALDRIESQETVYKTAWDRIAQYGHVLNNVMLFTRPYVNVGP